MTVNIHSVHFDADTKLLEYVNFKIKKLTHFEDRIIKVDVFLKLDKKSSKILKDILKTYIQKGVVYEEHEVTYPELMKKVKIGFESMAGMAWTEMDFEEDYKKILKLSRELLSTSEDLRFELSELETLWINSNDEFNSLDSEIRSSLSPVAEENRSDFGLFIEKKSEILRDLAAAIP